MNPPAHFSLLSENGTTKGIRGQSIKFSELEAAKCLQQANFLL